MTIESSWVFCRKTSQYYFDWTPTFPVLAKKHYFFFGIFNQVQSRSDGVCVFCHQLDNIHVKGNFILFAMTIESSWVFCRKTSQYYFDWTPVFDVSAKITKTFFGFSAKFKVVLMVFVLFCHQLDNDHVKGNFILFAMMIESSWVFCRKTSQKYFDWTPTFVVLAKKHYYFSIFLSSSKSFWWCLCCFAINLTIFMWKVISYSLQWRLRVREFFVGKRRNITLIGPRFLTFQQKSQKLVLVFRPSSKSFWWCLCCFAINLTMIMWKVISYSLQWWLKVREFFVGKRHKSTLIGPQLLSF